MTWNIPEENQQGGSEEEVKPALLGCKRWTKNQIKWSGSPKHGEHAMSRRQANQTKRQVAS